MNTIKALKNLIMISTVVLFAPLSMATLQTEDVEANNQGERIIVALDNAFIPEFGFDDNDNVQVVIEGYLPNSCYTLTQSQAFVDEQKNALVVQQIAMKSNRGLCAEGATLPPDLAAQRYFWKVVDVGNLNSGDYSLLFKSTHSQVQKSFRIQLSPTEEIDNMDYVLVGNAFANSVISSVNKDFEIRITGELTSSCAVLTDVPVIEQVGDVFVVLLNIQRTSEFCMPASRPFYRVLKAKTPSKGRYLLHVRSAGGESRNKIFEVVE